MQGEKIYVVAGEASGDLLGSNLVSHLRERCKDPLQIYGVGGDKMKAAGVLDFFDLAHFHATGFSEAIIRIPEYRRAERLILSSVQKAQPNLVVLIDNPGFNLHLAKKIHALKIPIVYYVSPQLWAWAPKRIHKIKKFVSKMLVLFEFEKRIYEENGVPVAWVGHPLKDLIGPPAPGPATSQGQERRVCLLPGSRSGEISYLLPEFIGAAQMIAKELPQCSFSIIQSPTLSKDAYAAALKRTSLPIRLVREQAYREIKFCDLAIVCSGTATLECALLGTPLIIANKSSFLTYLMVKKLIRVPYLGMPNLVLGEKKFPELLQDDATPEKIAAEALRILTHPAASQAMRLNLERVSEKLGPPGASLRAAEEILKML